MSGLNAVVVGRSNIVGKPMANLLLAANCTVTIAHSRTKDLPALARTADILVAAVGRPEMVQGRLGEARRHRHRRRHQPRAGAGQGRGQDQAGRRRRLQEAAKVAGAITPVPGGVGPMTIAMLMANTVTSAYLAAGRKRPVF